MSAKGGSASGGKTQINTQLVARLKFFSQIFSFLVFLTGFSALIGWQFNILQLKRVASSFPIIAPNTACAFFLGGAILFLIVNSKTKEKKCCLILARIVSFLIATVGFLTIMEYIFKVDIGIDRLFFSERQGLTAVRMSPQSAFNFFMVGISLLFVAWQKKEKIRIGQVIVLLAGVVSLVSLFGFIYNISSFYTIAPYKGMAAHTAVAFLMMFLGILLSHPEIGFMRIFSSRSPSGVAARRLFVTLVFILVMEILVIAGKRNVIFGPDTEALVHLLVVTAVFIYLIFFAFRSLDELGKMETSLAKSRELDRAKTEFVGLASHQLRTPLTAVSWYAEMLLGKDAGKLGPKQEEYLREIYAGNQRMIDLVDDLLNTSRIDMGTLKMKSELVSVGEIIESTLNEFMPQIDQKKITLEKKLTRNLPLVKLDPELIGIVFQNIISNAVKYTPTKGKVAVEMKRQNSHILVKITDNGWGIPAGQQRRIFTKLFRADNVRKRDTEGTGLGLYIARAIIKRSGGKIWFESKENKGTTFYISFKA